MNEGIQVYLPDGIIGTIVELQDDGRFLVLREGKICTYHPSQVEAVNRK